MVSSKLFWHAAFLFAAAGSAVADPIDNTYVPTSKTPWQMEAPGASPRLASLWGRREAGQSGTLLNVPAGFKSGSHAHTADYRAVVVSGEWVHQVPSTREGVGAQLKPGAYWTQKRDQWHIDECISKTPCTIFLFNEEPYRTYFEKDQIKPKN
jgi:hypothetical protein